MSDAVKTQLIELNQNLLDSIAKADWLTYQKLCDPSISCFEPEARGNLVEGLAFHKYYFDLGAPSGARNTTMASPHVRLLGADCAVVSYVRLVQKLDASNSPLTAASEETRVWQRMDGQWKHVHFHRTAL
jgi:hypothetical protein